MEYIFEGQEFLQLHVPHKSRRCWLVELRKDLKCQLFLFCIEHCFIQTLGWTRRPVYMEVGLGGPLYNLVIFSKLRNNKRWGPFVLLTFLFDLLKMTRVISDVVHTDTKQHRLAS